MAAVVSLSVAATQVHCRVHRRQCRPIRLIAERNNIHRKDNQMDAFGMAQRGRKRRSATLSVRAGDKDEQVPEKQEENNNGGDETVSTATNNSNSSATEDASQDSAVLSTEEIQRQMGALRAAAAASSQDDASKDDSLVQGVLEEVRLIEWPSFTSALLNTLLVIALVLGTSVVLFGVNTSLSEISRQIYSSSSSSSSL